MTWTIADAYTCSTCEGALCYLVDEDGDPRDQPMQCIELSCAAVVWCDMDTGEWHAGESDPDRALAARSTS